jgi:hypothetical protein
VILFFRSGRGVFGPVAYYRLYYLDGLSGHVDHFREFEAESDEAAIAYADDTRGLTPMELWSGERKIKDWEAFPPVEG